MSMNAIPYASMGVGAITGGINSFAQWKQGSAEQAAYNYNAKVTLANMTQEEIASERKFAGLMGRQRALYAKAGVDIASGSPLLVLADTAMQAKTEQDRIQTAGESQSEIQKYYGRMASYKGKVGAMTSFLTTINKTAADYYNFKEGF
jgi:hypothetical protein